MECVACESTMVEEHEEIEKLRPNGEQMRMYSCKDCGQSWAE